MVMGATIRVVMGRSFMVGVTTFRRLVVVAMAGLLGLGYNLGRGTRALHADRKRAPNREEHCQQQQEPEAKDVHDS